MARPSDPSNERTRDCHWAIYHVGLMASVVAGYSRLMGAIGSNTSASRTVRRACCSPSSTRSLRPLHEPWRPPMSREGERGARRLRIGESHNSREGADGMRVHEGPDWVRNGPKRINPPEREAASTHWGRTVPEPDTSQSLAHAYALFDYITELPVELDHRSV
jgi:hypothetical protein